jgi:hypothetical protein
MKARYGVREEARDLWRHWFAENDIPLKQIAYGEAVVSEEAVELSRFITDDAGHRVLHICNCEEPGGHYAKERATFPITEPLGDWARHYLIGEVEA